MSKQVNVAERDQWDEKETLNNIKYLEDRGRYEEAATLREEQGLDPLKADDGVLEDRLLTLDKDRRYTSDTGVNDSPEVDPDDPKQQGVKHSRTKGGEPGPHGRNSDQFVADAEEQAKNRPSGSNTDDGQSKKGRKGKNNEKTEAEESQAEEQKEE